MKTSFTPITNRILVKKDEVKTKTESGIELSPNSVNQMYFTGEVIATGPDVTAVVPKNKIAFAKYGYDEIELDGEKLCLIEEPAVFGIYG